MQKTKILKNLAKLCSNRWTKKKNSLVLEGVETTDMEPDKQPTEEIGWQEETENQSSDSSSQSKSVQPTQEQNNESYECSSEVIIYWFYPAFWGSLGHLKNWHGVF